ncbi:hypothetical protein [Shimazuella kribbensis]|uniref:hypothetical protein n=1 Tax=Shimazuella kribbensis TaxID=139808 RepID=UPI00048C9177|nr:hypothetical protein [Shimazuella kribbensis]
MKNSNRLPHTRLRELVTRYNQSLQKWKDKRDELRREVSVAEQELTKALVQREENATPDGDCLVEECRNRKTYAERRITRHERNRPFQKIINEANMFLFDERDREEFDRQIDIVY